MPTQNSSAEGHEVTLSPQDAADAKRLLMRLVANIDEFDHKIINGDVNSANIASYLYEIRRMRDKFLPKELFADPAWDILLILYSKYLSHERLSVSAVCGYAGVPATTALRWIENLHELNLVVKERDFTDRRVTWLTLSDQARSSLSEFFGRVIADHFVK